MVNSNEVLEIKSFWGVLLSPLLILSINMISAIVTSFLITF